MKKTKLAEWMFENNETYQSLAQKLGCSMSLIRLLKNGDIGKSLIYAHRLLKITKGKVTLDDLVSSHKVKSNKVKSKDCAHDQSATDV